MNAGAYGLEFKDIIYGVTAVNKNGQLLDLSLEDLGFGYRCNRAGDLVFVAAKLKIRPGCANEISALMAKINTMRAATQPIKQKTAGSTFANPPGHKAWQLIEQVGLKGYILNQAQFSPLHCNFLINLGGATASDLENLGELARQKVFAQTGIDLQWEVKRLGQKI
jgi:UDP-N-acetylmuramate dehydrogenase